MSPHILRNIYTCTIESILTGKVYGQQKCWRSSLPHLQDIYAKRCSAGLKSAESLRIPVGPIQYNGTLSLLWLGSRIYLSRGPDIFYPQAIQNLNEDIARTDCRSPSRCHAFCIALEIHIKSAGKLTQKIDQMC